MPDRTGQLVERTRCGVHDVVMDAVWECTKFVDECGVPRTSHDADVAGLGLAGEWVGPGFLVARHLVAAYRISDEQPDRREGTVLARTARFLLDPGLHRMVVPEGVTLGSLPDGGVPGTTRPLTSYHIFDIENPVVGAGHQNANSEI